ncbi:MULTISPECIES: hypothetical protein [Micromonospora]|uniref:Uncharacterized protein n=1 Tax=Micromonospora sicca TaxID=2202420 RepID=A0A317D5S1_9ACTN|nr:hypothetical protein [Micromonospora sp. 4G51]PWR10198.1 hypothetical protein DKT69_29565 [Micromonospora sp. 4G51]
MASVRRRDRSSTSQREEQLSGQPSRLPLRWAVIGILALTAGIIGFVAGGPVAAITTAVAVALGAHQMIA